MHFDCRCIRHPDQVLEWIEPSSGESHPMCDRCEILAERGSGHGTLPLWWITTEDGKRIGWAHIYYGGHLNGSSPFKDEIGNLPLGLGCILPSGRKATVWAKSVGKREETVEVIREDDLSGESVIFPGGMWVRPIPEWSPHENWRRARSRLLRRLSA